MKTKNPITILGQVLIFLSCAAMVFAYTTADTDTYPPCVPKPYDIEIDMEPFSPEQQKALTAFLDQLNYQGFDELYLRLCTWLDTTYAERYCSLKTNFLYGGDCGEHMLFHARRFFFKNDTSLHEGVNPGGAQFWMYDQTGDKAVEINWPDEINANQYAINWPDTFPNAWYNANQEWLWMYKSSGGTHAVKWHKFDDAFIQYKSSGTEVYDAAAGTIDTIIFPDPYGAGYPGPAKWHYQSNGQYSVFTQWVDSQCTGIASPTPIWINGSGGHFSDSSFRVEFPPGSVDGARWQWITVGDLKNDPVS